MIELLILWIGLLVALLAFAVGPPGRGGALTLAYFLDMSLIHVPGVFVFLDDAIRACRCRRYELADLS